MPAILIFIICLVAVFFQPVVDCSSLYYSEELSSNSKDAQEKMHVTAGGEDINQKSTQQISKPSQKAVMEEKDKPLDEVLADFDPNTFANDLFNDIKNGGL